MHSRPLAKIVPAGSTMKHPLQALVEDRHVIRFVENPLVRYLLDNGGIDLNTLAKISQREKFALEDWEQFAQLIGYSFVGWGELTYVSDEAYALAEEAADKLHARAIEQFQKEQLDK